MVLPMCTERLMIRFVEEGDVAALSPPTEIGLVERAHALWVEAVRTHGFTQAETSWNPHPDGPGEFFLPGRHELVRQPDRIVHGIRHVDAGLERHPEVMYAGHLGVGDHLGAEADLVDRAGQPRAPVAHQRLESACPTRIRQRHEVVERPSSAVLREHRSAGIVTGRVDVETAEADPGGLGRARHLAHVARTPQHQVLVDIE